MNEVDDPAQFDKLSPEQQLAIVTWCKAMYAPATEPRLNATSYGMKHDFGSHVHGGFYVYNGAFKGAMLAAGFKPVDKSAKNWVFSVYMTMQHRRLHRAEANHYR